MWHMLVEAEVLLVPETQSVNKEVGEGTARKILPDLESLEFQA